MSYARVHHDLILPSLEELVGLDDDPSDWTSKTRIQTTGSVRRIPSADAIVRSSRPLMTPPIPRPAVQTVITRKSVARAMRWPVFLCGFVAGIFGGLALVKSPVGHQPAVVHLMHQLGAATR